MFEAQLPELSTDEDLAYMRSMFLLQVCSAKSRLACVNCASVRPDVIADRWHSSCVSMRDELLRVRACVRA
eukprot:COSAG01_NODE_538_length_15761_cov_8.160388_4_plen_71_part_00